MNYIKRNIIKLNFIVIGISLILLPILFLFNYNFSSEETYKKDYYILKSGTPEYIDKIYLSKNPIINSETLLNFTKEAVIDIFNYKTHEANDHARKIQKYFSDLGYEIFKPELKSMILSDMDTNAVIKKTIVIDGPYLLGTGKLLSGERLWKYVLNTMELRSGLGGTQKKIRSVELILKEIKFSENNKGVAIDSMIVK